MCYSRSVQELEPQEVSVRDLRNRTSEVLRRVEAGERFRVTAAGRPVAQIVPHPRRRASMPFAEFLAWKARTGGADPGLAEELRAALPDTTEDVRLP
jgi:prevent-host-death family protein